MTDAKSLTTPRSALPFGGDFDQVLNRMMRGWPFGWPEMAPSSAPKALQVFDHVPKVEVKENGKAYTVRQRSPWKTGMDLSALGRGDAVGRVSVSTAQNKLIATLGAGECFGEAALLGEEVRNATVSAETDVNLVAIEKKLAEAELSNGHPMTQLATLMLLKQLGLMNQLKGMR